MADEHATGPKAEAGDAVPEQTPEEAQPAAGTPLGIDADSPHFVEAWSTYDPSLRFVAVFPITENKGATESSAAYYIIEPGRHSGLHSDNAEEIVFVTEGVGEVYVMGGSRKLEAGQFHVFPAGVPHDVYAHGGSALRLLSFFPTSEIVSTYQETMYPMGTPVISSLRPGPRLINFGPDGAGVEASEDDGAAAADYDSPLMRAIGMTPPGRAAGEAEEAPPDSASQPQE